MAGGSNPHARSGNSRFRQGKDFIKLTIYEFDRDLHPVERVFAGEINRTLRVLKIVGLERVGRPITEAAQVKLRADMLQQNFHILNWSCCVRPESELARPFVIPLSWVRRRIRQH